MGYAFGDSPEGQGMGEAHQLPGTHDPLQQALAALAAIGASGGAPAAIGNELMTAPAAAFVPPVQNVGTDLSFAPTGAPTTAPGGPVQNGPDFPVGIDRIGAERGEPDLSGTAGFDPNAPVFTPPQVPGDHAQAQRMEADQLARTGKAALDASAADHAARQDLLSRQAAATEKAAADQLDLNMTTERATEKANALADAETASWLTDMSNLAKQEPNPGRWWENQSGLGKALWALGMLFGAGHAALTPGAKNAALEMVNQEIANDVALQDARLKREMATAQLKGQVMRDKHQRNLSDVKDRHARAYTRLMALERAYAARAVVPGDLDAQAGKMQAMAQFEQWKLPIAGAYRQEAFQAKQQGIAQAHSARQAKLARDAAAQQAANERAKDIYIAELNDKRMRDLAPVSVSASYKPGGAIPVDDKGIPVLSVLQSGQGAPAAGLVLKGPGGQLAHGTGEIRFRDEKTMQTAGEIVSKANARYTTVKNLVDYLETASGSEALVQLGAGVVDPKLNDLVTKLGYETAKEHDARITNQDFSKGTSQAMGFDPNGKWLDRVKFYANRDEIVAKLKDDLANMPEVVNNNIRPLNDAAINGQGTEAVWDPNLLTAPKVDPRSQNTVEGRPNLDLNTVKEPITADWYTKRAVIEEKNTSRAGQLLPDHDDKTINALIASTQGRGPAGIEAEARRALAAVEGRLESYAQVDAAGAEGVGVVAGLTPEERRQFERDINTKRIADAIIRNEVEKAGRKLQQLEKDIRFLQKKVPGYDWSSEAAHNKAERMGLGNAHAEVDEIVKKLKNIK